MRHRIILLTVLVSFAAVPSVRPDDHNPKDPPQGVFTDAWMSLLLKGEKIGYAHTVQSRWDNDIHTTTRTYMLIKRSGMPIEISATEEVTETITGQPTAFSSELIMAEQPIRLSGQIENGMVTVAGEQFGQKSIQTVPYPEGALMAWGTHLESLKYPPEVGTRFTMDTYVPMQALNVAVPVKMEVVAEQELNHRGQKIKAIKTKTLTRISGVDVEAEGWWDKDWQPLKQQFTIMNFTIEMVITDKKTALENIGGAEMFLNTLIPINRHIDRDKTQSVTFRILADPGTALPEIPETQMQKIVGRKPDEIVLKVSRLDHPGLRGVPDIAPPDELEPYLKPSLFVSSADPKVLELAREAAGTERQHYRLADRLRRKVSQVVEFEDLGTGFATAAEVCRNRKGDCTENGVLLAAIGRAMGIPTRVVTGLIYIPEYGSRHNLMGFHMWTQFWINGTWMDLDSAWNQTDVDPTHIALGLHSTEHASLGSMVSSVMLQLDRYRIEVQDIELKK